MNELFDPSQLCPDASLNRARILQLPGMALPQDVIGKTGYELISAAALSRMIRLRREELELTPPEMAMTDRDLPPCLDPRLKSGNARIAQAANGVVREFARNAACVILSMAQSRPAGYQPQSEWED